MDFLLLLFSSSGNKLRCRLHPYLPSDCFTTVVCGLVTMRLNYSNSLLASLTVKLPLLQFVVNAESGLLIELGK